MKSCAMGVLALIQYVQIRVSSTTASAGGEVLLWVGRSSVNTSVDQGTRHHSHHLIDT